MLAWKVIWNVYEKLTNKSSIFRFVWNRATFGDRLYGLVLVIIFIGSAFLHFFIEPLIIISVVLSEMAFLWKLYQLEDKVIEVDLGGSESLPPNNKDKQSTRYLIFKHRLCKPPHFSGSLN